MNRSRITTAATTVALLGGLAVTQMATAGSAFAYDSGADLNVVLSGGFMYNKGTGKVLGDGIGGSFGNHGPEATTATVTLTAVKNVRFTAKPKVDKGTVKSWNAKKVVIQANLGPNDSLENMDLPANVYGSKQTLRADIKGDKADPDPSNNTKTANYSVDAPKPGKPKPTEKPTEKPTGKPSEKPSDKPTGKPTDEPTSKPSEDANTPAPAGGSDKGDSGGKGDLAETGGNSNTPLLVGGAGALVVIGGLAVFASKRRRAGQS